MAPQSIIDQIIVYELAHLVEQNHTENFWQFVEEQIPDYEEKVD